GVFRRCRELGLSVPQDVRIYGFDDNPLNEWLAPWLDTVRVPHIGFARSSIQQMRNLNDGGTQKDVILPYELIIRS
ncbi:MAG: substrate-binding domain-containing protein, partial [Pseudomonadota bacterium]